MCADCSALKSSCQVQSTEHGDALLPKRIVFHTAFVVEDHSGPVLGVECRPFGQPALRGGVSRTARLALRAPNLTAP